MNAKLTQIVILISFITYIQMTQKQRILYISDIHLDLYYDSTASISSYQCKKIIESKTELQFDSNVTLNENDFGKLGCDTNLNLLNLMISKAYEEHLIRPFDKIIILGDSISHMLNMDKTNIKDNYEKTYLKIKEILLKYFSKLEIIFSIGNNDFVERYQTPQTIDNYNTQLTRIKSNLIFSSQKENIFKERTTKLNDKSITYLQPFYFYNISDNIVGIVINSIIFSEENQLNSSDFNEMLILEQFSNIVLKLDELRKMNKKAIFHYHIPIHCNYYKKMMNNWVKKLSHRFDLLIKEYQDVVIMIFSSHLHGSKISIREELTNDFLKEKKYYMPVFNIPAISPSNITNPGFSIIDISDNSIDNIISIFLDLELSNNKTPTFNYFDVKESFNLDNFYPITIYQFLRKRDSNILIFDKYLYYHTGGITQNTKSTLKNMFDSSEITVFDEKMIKCESYIIDISEMPIRCYHILK